MNSDDVLREWAERSGEYSPDYYAYYGPNETSDRIRARLDAAVGTDASVLELGCSSGRHLAHLREHGYGDLHGVDVNDEAFEVMADAYPDLRAEGTFHAAAIENVVREFGDGRFDAVFSVETLQHVHPDNEWVFDELARVTADLLLTVENEGDEDGEGDERGGGGEGREGKTERSESESDERDVNYVRDDLPLYYRDWHRVFTERGLAEVEAESLDRDTLRTFRTRSDGPASRGGAN